MCGLYLLACQLRATVGDSGLCCCVCVTTFERQLTPLCVDSAWVLWASFCFSFVLAGQQNSLKPACALAYQWHWHPASGNPGFEPPAPGNTKQGQTAYLCAGKLQHSMVHAMVDQCCASKQCAGAGWGNIDTPGLSGTFLHTARTGYATHGSLFITAHPSTDTVRALGKVRGLIRPWKQQSVQARM